MLNNVLSFSPPFPRFLLPSKRAEEPSPNSNQSLLQSGKTAITTTILTASGTSNLETSPVSTSSRTSSSSSTIPSADMTTCHWSMATATSETSVARATTLILAALHLPLAGMAIRLLPLLLDPTTAPPPLRPAENDEAPTRKKVASGLPIS